MSAGQWPILVIGIEERVAEYLLPLLRSAKLTVFSTVEEYQGRKLGDGMFAAIFCGPALGLPPVGIATQLHDACPRTPKFYVTLDSKTYEAKRLLDNGFDEAFLLPIDKQVLKKTIEEKVLVDDNEKSFQPLRIVDLIPGTKLDFDTYVFLPLNTKYVKFTFAGQPFDESKLEKLKTRKLDKLFIEQKDTNKFYQYVARQLHDLNDETLPKPERLVRLRAAVRTIFADVFDPSLQSDPEQGKAIMDTCQKVVSNYITKGASSDWYQRLLQVIGEATDTYSHAMNVSTFAALFAIGMNHPNPKDLAMAGLLHDIGMTTLPEAIANKPYNKLNGEERALYDEHPNKTLEMLRSKKIALSAEVEAAILQHHEKTNGSGPNGLSGDEISLEAQIVAFADQFDYLTRFEGSHGLSLADAFTEIRRSNSIHQDLIDLLKPLLNKHSPPVVRETA